jgi:hypothetical protein
MKFFKTHRSIILLFLLPFAFTFKFPAMERKVTQLTSEVVSTTNEEATKMKKFGVLI